MEDNISRLKLHCNGNVPINLKMNKDLVNLNEAELHLNCIANCNTNCLSLSFP